jgi:hypothetical protein
MSRNLLGYVLLVVVSACGALGQKLSPDEREAFSADGELKLTVREHGRISGSCTQAGTTVLFDAIRGTQTDAELRRRDPETPSHEIDARFKGLNGQPFLTQIGGHGFILATWGAEEQLVQQPDLKAREGELAAVGHCSSRIADELRTEEEQPERDALVRLGRMAYERSPADGQRTSSGFTHWISVYSKPIVPMFNWLNLEHSATLSVVTAGKVLAKRVTCNHGSCAGTSGMKVKCTKSYGNRPASLPNIGQCGTSTSYQDAGSPGCCNSSYGLFSGHVCNTDTAFQLAIMQQYPAACPVPPFCNSTDPKWHAPDCD